MERRKGRVGWTSVSFARRFRERPARSSFRRRSASTTRWSATRVMGGVLHGLLVSPAADPVALQVRKRRTRKASSRSRASGLSAQPKRSLRRPPRRTGQAKTLGSSLKSRPPADAFGQRVVACPGAFGLHRGNGSSGIGFSEPGPIARVDLVPVQRASARDDRGPIAGRSDKER